MSIFSNKLGTGKNFFVNGKLYKQGATTPPYSFIPVDGADQGGVLTLQTAPTVSDFIPGVKMIIDATSGCFYYLDASNELVKNCPASGSAGGGSAPVITLTNSSGTIGSSGGIVTASSLFGSISVSGDTPIVYTWTAEGSSNPITFNDAALLDPTLTIPGVPGNYQLKLLAVNATGQDERVLSLSVAQPVPNYNDVITPSMAVIAHKVGQPVNVYTGKAKVDTSYTDAFPVTVEFNFGDASAVQTVTLTASGQELTADRTYTAEGTYSTIITFTYSDGTQDVVTGSVNVTMPVVNLPPTVQYDRTSYTTPVGGEEISAATAFGLNHFNDPEGVPLTYDWVQLSGPATVTMDYSHSPSPVFTVPATAGTYLMQLTFSDGVNDVVKQLDFVVPASANQLPGGSIYAASYDAATGNINVGFDVSDPEGDQVAYEIKVDGNSVGVSGTANAGDSTGRAITGVAAGTHIISLWIAPVGGTLVQVDNRQVTVSTTNSPPVLTSPTTVSVHSGDTLATTIATSDPDGDTVTVSLLTTGDSNFFNYDAATGQLTFKSAPDYAVPQDFDADNVYEVGLHLVDTAGNSTNTVVSVAVTPAVDTVPPQITTFTLGVSASSNPLHVTLGYAFLDDGNKDALTMIVDWGDGSVETFNGESGRQIYDVKDHTYSQNGTYTVTLSVDDGSNAAVTDTRSITVSCNGYANDPTLHANNPTVSLAVGQTVMNTTDWDIWITHDPAGSAGFPHEYQLNLVSYTDASGTVHTPSEVTWLNYDNTIGSVKDQDVTITDLSKPGTYRFEYQVWVVCSNENNTDVIVVNMYVPPGGGSSAAPTIELGTPQVNP